MAFDKNGSPATPVSIGNMGEHGSIEVSDTTPRVGPFSAMKAYSGDADVVLGTVTGNSSWLTGKTLVAGEPAEVGRFETVARASGGKLILYYASAQTT